MSMKKIITGTIFILMVISCSGAFTTAEPPQEAPSNGVTISLGMAQNSRTIIPELATQGIYYQLDFSGPVAVNSIVTESNISQVELADGAWTITASVFNSSDGLITTGTGNITVPAETELSIPLSLQQSGTGDLSLDFQITMPSGINISSIAASLTSLSDSTVTPLTVTGTASPYRISGSGISSGAHILTSTYTTSTTITLPLYSEVVWIFDNILTEAEIILNEEHFTSLPEAPRNFYIDNVGSRANLSWKDAATNESGFRIERKEDGGTFTTIAEINSPNTESYIDTTVVSGVGYVYRIFAIGALGESETPVTSGYVLTPERLYVKEGGTGSGISWEHAAGDLQQAIENARSFNGRVCHIWVAQGTYTPDSNPAEDNFNGTEDVQRYNCYRLRNGVRVYGGFIGNETDLSQRDPWTNVTILSGDLANDDIVTGSGATLSIINNEENSIHLFYAAEHHIYGNRNLLDGFTLRGGHANSDYPHDRGGLVLSLNFSINNCVIENNSALKDGGGIGGLNLDTDDTYINNCIFMNNQSGNWGGAIYPYTGLEDYQINNCIFYGNRADTGGAFYVNSIYSTNSSFSFDNCVFLNNWANQEGGALYYDCTKLFVENCIFQGNSSSNNDAIYQFRDSAAIELSSSIIEEDANSIYLRHPAMVTMDRVFHLNPQFVNINNPRGADGLWGTSDDGISLAGSSPAVNMGLTDYLPEDSFDLDRDGNKTEPLPHDLFGNPRSQQGALDLGAVESTHSDSMGPSPVTVLQAEPASTIASISWTDPTDVDFKEVAVTWTPAHGISQPLIIERGLQEATITGLSDGTEYSLSVVARDITGNESTAQSSSVTPNPQPLPDAVITNYYPTLDSITLEWTDPTTGIWDHLEVSWTPAHGDAQPVSVSPGTQSLTVNGLTPETEYSFTINTIDLGGHSSTGVTQNISTIRTIYVNDDATGLSNGSSWADAYQDLSKAIEISQEGMEIWVAQGSYIPTINFLHSGETDPIFSHFMLKKGLSILGGFNGTETAADQRDPWSNPCILNADINNDDTIGIGISAPYHWYLTYGATKNILNLFYMDSSIELDETAILDGFTLQGGIPSSGSIWNGGAIYCSTNSTNSTFTIRNCIFRRNFGYFKGGAIYGVTDLPIRVENSIFIKNGNNTCDGGAIYAQSAEILNSVFYDNLGRGGGALYIVFNHGPSTISGCSFINNSSDQMGAAIFNNSEPLKIENTLFWGNTSQDGGDTYYSFFNSAVVEFSNVLYEASGSEFAGITATDITFTNCSNADPQLNDIADGNGPDDVWGSADDGLWYTTGSPLHNGGNSSLLPIDSSDLDWDGNTTEVLPVDLFGNQRLQGSAVDIGPYELTP